MSSHTTPWGQAFEAAAGSPEKNIRIHVRNFCIYALVGGSWRLLANSDQVGIGGGNYKEDFTGGSGGSTLKSEGTGQVSFNMMPGRYITSGSITGRARRSLAARRRLYLVRDAADSQHQSKRRFDQGEIFGRSVVRLLSGRDRDGHDCAGDVDPAA